MSAFAALVAVSVSTYGQEGDVDATKLDDLLVTVQKKVQTLQEVPASVGVIHGETLDDFGSYDPGTLESYVANIEIDSDPQAPVVGIRGFSTETDNVGFESSVGLVMDELALGRPEFLGDGLFDLDRIEVLRGSQGTLFGKNTIAGVITFQTREPDDTFAATFTGAHGQPGEQRLEGGVTVPLMDELTARIAGVWWEKDGQVENSTLRRLEGSTEQSAGRMKLVATPGDNWRIGLSSQRSSTEVVYGPWQLYAADEDALAYAREFDASSEDDPLDFHTTENVPGFVQRDSALTRGVVTYGFGDVWYMRNLALTLVAGRASFDIAALIDIDASAADLVATDFGIDYRQDSIELRLSGTSGSLAGVSDAVDWVVGVYGLRSDIVSHLNSVAGQDLIDFAGSNAGLEALGAPTAAEVGTLFASLPDAQGPLDDEVRRNFGQRQSSGAAFGELTWKLTDRLAAIVGGRLTLERKTAAFEVSTVGPGIIAAVVGAEPFAATEDRRESDFSPKAGLQYRWPGDVASYVVMSRGFKSGGFNATTDTDSNLQFEPERAKGVEAGIKARLLDGKLAANFAVYRTDVADLQVVDFVGTAYEVRNAAAARLEGIELDMRWRPDSNWFALNGVAALSQARYLEYPNAPAAPEDGSAESQDLAGRTLPHAPRFTTSLTPLFEVQPEAWPFLRLRGGLSMSYRSSQYSSSDLDSHSFQRGYPLLSTFVAIASSEDLWSLSLKGSNLTNQGAIDLVMENPVYANTYVSPQQIPGRTWMASLSARW